MSESYSRIVVSIGQRAGDGSYPVRAALDNGQEFAGDLVLDEEALRADNLDPEAYGRRLFKALFHERIRDAYVAAKELAANKTDGQLRIQIAIDKRAPGLHALPWERLYHIHRGQLIPLAATADTPFSRYTALPIADPEPVSERPVRMLFATANPSNLPSALAALDVEAEVRNLELAAGDLQARGRLKITILPGRTGLAPETVERLRDGGFEVAEGETSLNRILDLLATHRLLHFLGHGQFLRSDDGEGRARLLLEDANGQVDKVPDNVLTQKLAALDSPPLLVFLAACESAKRDREHPSVGLAPKLVRAGVPAVVAMQDLVPMEMTQRLTAAFYSGLLRHGLPDRALNESRLVVFSQERTDWAIPVLFMRLSEGRLFEPDPVRDALTAIQSWATDPWAALPVEVAHYEEPGEVGGPRELRDRSRPTRDLIEKHLELFSRPRGSGSGKGAASGLIVLVGERGSTKSTQIRRLALHTATASLEEGAESVVPVVVNLARLSSVRPGLGHPLESLIFEAIEPFWPGLRFDSLSQLPAEVVLRVFFDAGEELDPDQRGRVWQSVFDLVRRHRRHQYCLAVEGYQFDPERLKAAADLLVIQPLSTRILHAFLEGKGKVGRSLYEALAKAQLFDLAAIPWLLFAMLDQAEHQDLYPRSRSEVLRTMFEDAVIEIPASQGMRSRTRRTLRSLAWKMHGRRTHEWPIEQTLDVIANAKGKREYSLEGLLDRLVDVDLLSRLGDDAIRFSYPSIQSFCSAEWLAAADRADRERWLDDIGASLGRLTRLRWWDEALVLLCGIMRNPNGVLSSLLYGASLAEGEEVFLAVRCILESRSSARSTRKISKELLGQVVDTLVWRLDPANVGVTGRRARALDALGLLGEASTVPDLARVANQEVRLNWKGELDYDYSLMRMHAAVALERMMDRHSQAIAGADGELHEILDLWRQNDFDALVERLRGEDLNTRSLAVFALGHLRGEAAPKAQEELIQTFLRADTAAATRWAIADAMTRFDSETVVERAILPFLVEGSVASGELEEEAWRKRGYRYDCLAYLIGKINAQHPSTRGFLDRCLTEFSRISVKARAIQSLGWMHESGQKELFEAIAAGDLERLNLSDKAKPGDRRYLRRKAIGALAALGDRRTVKLLRTKRQDWHPELERALYWTAEEISWRVSASTGR